MSNRNVQAKNRAPASIQITAEQILREAKDRQLDVEVKAPRQQITDVEELRVFRMRKRKEVCGHFFLPLMVLLISVVIHVLLFVVVLLSLLSLLSCDIC